MKTSLRNILVATFVGILCIGGGALFYKKQTGDSIFVLPSKYHIPFLSEIGKDILTAPLSETGVIEETNVKRNEAGLPPLVSNAKLSKAAEAKISDMFNKQYFEHISPDGRAPKDLAETAGYSYVVIGENLALGNFKGDQGLLDAWMKSEGHRENILNERYEEIGVAVRRGEYEGKSIWLAVQEFGKPESSCPSVSEEIKASIDREKIEVSEKEASVEREKYELDQANPETSEEIESYNDRVRTYNRHVADYQKQSADLKHSVDDYNEAVRAYNSCVQS